MKILFLIPPHPARSIPVSDGMPLGILYLASMVKTDNEIRITDAFSHPDKVDLKMEISSYQPDLVAISIPFRMVEKTALNSVKIIRENSDAVIVLGGLHASHAHARIRKAIDHDYFIPGESEFVFSQLIEYLKGKSSFLPEGVLKCSDNPASLVFNHVNDIDRIPFPARDLLPYRDTYLERVLTSRGCGHGCGFCSSKSFWGGFRGRDTDSIIDEIELIYSDRGKIPISFADDSFTYSRKRVLELCDNIKSRDIRTAGIGFSSHPAQLDKEMLEEMRSTGFDSIFLGLESASDQILKKLGKSYDIYIIESLIRYSIELGYDVHGSFMIGLPGEGREDVELTLTWADSLPLKSVGFHIFYPFEGCHIRENPEYYGISFTEQVEHDGDIDGEAIVHNGILTPNEILDYYYRARAIARRKLTENRNKYGIHKV